MISVIIPVYNVEIFLKRCIDSVLNQTYPHLEIILIDDGSTDFSGDICDRYAQTDKRVVVAHQKNAGLSAARNRGLDIANGEYIGFVDSDDYIDADMYRVLYNKAVETGSDIVECDLRHTYKNTEDIEKAVRHYDKKDLVCFGRGVAWNKLYRYRLIQETGVRFPAGLIYEDMEFHVKLIPFVNGYEYVDIAPYHYVQRKKSLNNKSGAITKHVFTILTNIDKYYEQKGIYDEYREALEFYWTRILLCSSFSRMCCIPGVSERNSLLGENWQTLVTQYPKWKNNAILKTFKSKQGMFMRSINPVTYKMYSKIFPIAGRIFNKISTRKFF